MTLSPKEIEEAIALFLRQRGFKPAGTPRYLYDLRGQESPAVFLYAEVDFEKIAYESEFSDR